MTESNYYNEADHGPHEIFALGDYLLECGITLPNAKIAYKTRGTLNEAKDNVILPGEIDVRLASMPRKKRAEGIGS